MLASLLKPYFLQTRIDKGKVFLGKRAGFGIYAIDLPNGLKLRTNLSDTSQRHFVLSLLNKGIDGKKIAEDYFNLKFMEEVLGPGDTMLDIGSNIGIYGLHAAKRVGHQGAVHCFEPLDDNLSLLRSGIELNGFTDRIQVNPIGLLDCPGTFMFTKPRYGGSGLGMFVKNKDCLDQARQARTCSLEVDTLDNYVARKNVTRIQFMKLDVEGAEASVLRGGLRTMREIRPQYVQLEFGVPHGTSISSAETPQDLFRFMTDLGYQAFYFQPIPKLLRFEAIDQAIQDSPGNHMNLIFSLNLPPGVLCAESRG